MVRRGSVRDFTDGGRPDEYRGGPKPPVTGHEGIYARGIASTRAAIERARLSHPSDEKTRAVSAALGNIAQARVADSAYNLLTNGEPTDPRREGLGRYKDGEHALQLATEYYTQARELMVRACGACTLDCFMNGRPRSFVETFEDPNRRAALRKQIKEAQLEGLDFDCSKAARTPAKQVKSKLDS